MNTQITTHTQYRKIPVIIHLTGNKKIHPVMSSPPPPPPPPPRIYAYIMAARVTVGPDIVEYKVKQSPSSSQIPRKREQKLNLCKSNIERNTGVTCADFSHLPRNSRPWLRFILQQDVRLWLPEASKNWSRLLAV